MVSTKLRRALELMKGMKEDGFENEIRLQELQTYIQTQLGGDKATVNSYPKFMATVGLIKEAGPWVFEFNWDKYSELAKKMVVK